MHDSSLFLDVADAIGLSNPTIVEKDYYVVQLLKLVKQVDTPYHRLVFSGGTALAKSNIKTYRMSEDVDLKLTPNANFDDNLSRAAKKRARKCIYTGVKALIENSDIFALDSDVIRRDEYRYICFDIKYPQVYQQAPCLRPYIKLELIESKMLSDSVDRQISSMYSEWTKEPREIESFTCTSIIDTQAEKLISMLRRTASHARNRDRQDDETLIRHIYDTHHIQLETPSDIDELSALVARVLRLDIERYGNQHAELVRNPVDELIFGLSLLENEPHHKSRYQEYVAPMVYAKCPATWDTAFTSFTNLTRQVLEKLSFEPAV